VRGARAWCCCSVYTAAVREGVLKLIVGIQELEVEFFFGVFFWGGFARVCVRLGICAYTHVCRVCAGVCLCACVRVCGNCSVCAAGLFPGLSCVAACYSVLMRVLQFVAVCRSEMIMILQCVLQGVCLCACVLVCLCVGAMTL